MSPAMSMQSSFSADLHRNIFPDPGAAAGDLRNALQQAAREHKHVIVNFGGDWCSDCKVLDYYFHQPPNDQLLARYYVIVDVNVGHLDENVDLAEKYGVPIQRGVPALVVLDGHGRVLFSAKNKESETMSRQGADGVTEFLNQWKPGR